MPSLSSRYYYYSRCVRVSAYFSRFLIIPETITIIFTVCAGDFYWTGRNGENKPERYRHIFHRNKIKPDHTLSSLIRRFHSSEIHRYRSWSCSAGAFQSLPSEIPLYTFFFYFFHLFLRKAIFIITKIKNVYTCA